ncbi:MAG: peptidase T [Candidatus Eremiobacteraeota bacterium]|nr:peptidase T [Candidatus Eremiobacteraeota bacterium]
MLLERFLDYVKIDTQSCEDAEKVPSTAKQFDLARLLVKELEAMGLKEVKLDGDHCYVYATVPSNLPSGHPHKVPVIAFIAHLDTSPSVTGAAVNPQLVKDYKGGDIVLPADRSMVITEKENPELALFKGGTIITTDGTTLLGADDKAGIAVIMEAVERLLSAGDIPHGEIKIVFTPDEEVGNGTAHFDVEGVGAQYAYTLDGERLGELNAETFNAASATVTFHGKNTHPGTAKGIMINSVYAMADFILKIPPGSRPETTEGREGYLHPYVLSGCEEKSEVKILLRDFDGAALEEWKKTVEKIRGEVAERYPDVRIEMVIKDSYRNMKEILDHHPRVLERAAQAMKKAGLEPLYLPIRGGTDGARLSFKGLPTPNIFMGCNNPHGKLEWVALEAMEKSVETILNIARLWAEEA